MLETRTCPRVEALLPAKVGGGVLVALAALTLAACSSETGEVPTASFSPGLTDPKLWPVVDSPVGEDAEIEAAVATLLARMTVEEKVGQVIQPEINSVTPDEVKQYRLGSVLNGGGGWPGTNKQSTPLDWLALADAFWEASMDVPEGRPAIPVMWGLDAVHGHNNVIGATLFPHNSGLGAANDPDLIREIGRVTAREVAVTGQDWDFGPTVAVARDGRWGRAYESYSESPEIVAAYARAMTEGLQGKAGSAAFLDGEHLIATAKHFIADGGTEGGVDQGDSVVSEETLRDVHGAGYFAALEAGVQTVMASFSSWHGTKLHGHRRLLTEVLKGRMGFDGIVVGDWNGHGQVEGCTNGNCPEAFMAGVDIFMVPQDWKELWNNTVQQVESGAITVERLDDAVRRILRVKMRAGLFERGKPSARPLAGRVEVMGSAAHREVARRAVRSSLVLLKNSGGLLPLRPNQHVLVAGDGADNIGKQSGGWTITWQGTGNTNDDFPGATSIWEGIRASVESGGGKATLSSDGSFVDRPDVAVVVFGEDPYAEFQGDRDSVDYAPGNDTDLALLRRFKQADIPVVAIFLTGRPLWVNPEINASDAFVVAWLPGTEGGGVADVVVAGAAGEVRHQINGRLPFSWPASPDQAVLNHDDPNALPLFAFGYGLSYADDGELAVLDESVAANTITNRTTFYDAGPKAPWRVILRDDDGSESVYAGSRAATQALSVRAIDRNVQEDALEARWSGTGSAALYLRAREPVDLSREANGEMALGFAVRRSDNENPSSVLRMSCGSDCSGALDISASLAGLPPGEWQEMAIRLRCFEDAGARMKSIDVPFSLVSSGPLTLGLADIRLVSATEHVADCP